MAAVKVNSTKRQDHIEHWSRIITRSLRENTSFKNFESEILRLLLKTPLDGAGILEAWAAAHDGGFTIRPRQIEFFEQMLRLKFFSHTDVLRRTANTVDATIFASERFLVKAGVAKGEYRQCLEATMLERLAYHLLHLRSVKGAAVDRTIDIRTHRPLLALISVYVQTVAALNILEGPALAIGTELGKYTGVFINDLSVTGILKSEDDGPPKALKSAFGRALPQFISILNIGASEVAQSLALLQQQSGLFESSNTEASQDQIADSLHAVQFQQTVLDTPLVITRAALYVFLNSMLSGRPICDDPALLTFLNSRYNGTVDSLVIDLVSASFDVLGIAINRTEPTESINIYRSFLINKVPVLLETFSHMLYPPASMEQCITNAVRSMDPSTDPFATQTFDLLSSSEMLSEARQEFLFACALYGLIPESSIETILGDVPMQNLPESGKYDRVQLVQQCATNPSRIEQLVDELENFEGQAAEITGALVQIVRDCCAGQDSITLKSICNSLSRKMNALDILMLFEEPKAILQPLCELLDDWNDEEEHSEYHPVYDEFSSIFLLILVFRQRYDLQISEIGITRTDSFIRQYLSDGLMPLAPGDLTTGQQSQLAGWVKGLYDSEGNLSDEPMSTCGPKSFHLLVSTLFDQSLRANQTGLLQFAVLQGGLGYFLEPFLLPALVTGLGWAGRRLWETPAAATAASPLLDHLLPLLDALVRPAALGAEAKALHDAVLATAAPALERALAHAQVLHPRRPDLEPLRAAVALRSPPLHAAGHAGLSELETWATGTQGGFVPGLRHTLSTLVAWSARASPSAGAGAPSAVPSPPPPQYTHRHLVHAVRNLGAPAALNTLLDEARRLIDGAPPVASAPQTNGATGGGHQRQPSAATAATTATYPAALVVDVLAALVVAPVVAPARMLMTLRQALARAAADAYVMSRRDRARAELVVRVERRVAAQTLVPVTAAEAGGVQGAPVMGSAADAGVPGDPPVGEGQGNDMVGLVGPDGGAGLSEDLLMMGADGGDNVLDGLFG